MNTGRNARKEERKKKNRHNQRRWMQMSKKKQLNGAGSFRRMRYSHLLY